MNSISPIPYSPKPFPKIEASDLPLSSEYNFSGYYVTEGDNMSNLTTASQSPIMSSHPSFASASTINSAGTPRMWQEGSPSKRVVGHCLNCSFKFYLRGTTKTEFCSRDCETCYLMFNKNGKYCKSMKSVDEIRKSIFEFQKELDQQQVKNVPPPPPTVTLTSPMARPPMIFDPRDLLGEEQTDVDDLPQTKTGWALNPAAALFNFTTLLTSPGRKKQQQ